MKRLIKPLIILAIITVAVFFTSIFREHLATDEIAQYLDNVGLWAIPIFMCCYIFATVFFVPGLILTLTAGLIFGLWLGTIVALTSATIGASCAFLIARYVAGDWVKQKTGKKLAPLLTGIEKEGWRFVAVVRLVPLLPFTLLNYALGVTTIKFWHYVIASFIFMLPGSFAYTYLGTLGKTAIEGEQGKLVQQIFIAIALLVIVSCIPYLVKKYRNRKES